MKGSDGNGRCSYLVVDTDGGGGGGGREKWAALIVD